MRQTGNTTKSHSDGPIGIDEYAGQAVNQTTRDPACQFTGPDHGNRRCDDVSANDLLLHGEYISNRILWENTIAGPIFF